MEMFETFRLENIFSSWICITNGVSFSISMYVERASFLIDKNAIYSIRKRRANPKDERYLVSL